MQKKSHLHSWSATSPDSPLGLAYRFPRFRYTAGERSYSGLPRVCFRNSRCGRAHGRAEWGLGGPGRLAVARTEGASPFEEASDLGDWLMALTAPVALYGFQLVPDVR